jgi:hypothetical protein
MRKPIQHTGNISLLDAKSKLAQKTKLGKEFNNLQKTCQRIF